MNWDQASQRSDGLWALQRQQTSVGQGHDAMTYVFLDMCNIGRLAGTVDDEEQVVAPVDEHQGVQNAALFVEQQAVALLVQTKAYDVSRHQRFRRSRRMGPRSGTS